MEKPYSINVKVKDSKQEIVVEGDLIINYIDDIKKDLLNSIDCSKSLNLKVENPSGLDITFIQIIYAIKASYVKSGKEFNIESKLNDEISVLLANAGIKPEKIID